jgi:NhaP-type Na+/H+ or K+/H+ antiporter
MRQNESGQQCLQTDITTLFPKCNPLLSGSNGLIASTVAGIVFVAREPDQETEKYDSKGGIELIIVITYFIFFGSILPYHQWGEIGVWKLVLFSLAVIFLRRAPIVLLLSPWVPALARHEDVKATLIEVGFRFVAF